MHSTGAELTKNNDRFKSHKTASGLSGLCFFYAPLEQGNISIWKIRNGLRFRGTCIRVALCLHGGHMVKC